MATFVLRTGDTKWIERNGGVVDADGKVTIQVPEGELGEMTFCGKPFVTYTLPDVPRDFGNRHAVCPKVWVA